MPVDRHPKTAELAQHGGALFLRFRHARAGVLVHVVNIADAAVGPAACAID